MTQTNARAGRATPSRVRQRNARPRAAAATGPARNVAESPIAWLFSRRDRDGNPLITQEQFSAGERLRADFWFAQMSPSVTQSWDAVTKDRGRRGDPGAGVDLADGALAAAERVRRALTAVGPELAGILIDVCCHLKGLEQAERKAGWPQRSGKIVLGVALSALARHYGFVAPRTPPPGAARVRHWGMSGYRPEIGSDEDAG